MLSNDQQSSPLYPPVPSPATLLSTSGQTTTQITQTINFVDLGLPHLGGCLISYNLQLACVCKEVGGYLTRWARIHSEWQHGESLTHSLTQSPM